MNNRSESILVVDDEDMIRRLICQKMGDQGYFCQTAASAEEAKKILAENRFALVLLDINMPGTPGTALLPLVKSDYPDTEVVMATAVVDNQVAMQCIRNGAYDYVNKPMDLDDLMISVTRALDHRRLIMENRTHQQRLEETVAVRTSELRQALEQLNVASFDTIQRLARAAEYRDEDTGNHIKRMSLYCSLIAAQLNADTKDVENIRYASPMHDIGKIGIPDRILLKPGALTPDEWEVMKQHTVIGGRILSNSGSDFIRLGEIIALTHHEKWDGSGYPKGLKAGEIPLAGRICAVADVFDALTSKRPYKEAYSPEKSFEMIEQQRAIHFDPDVVYAFLSIKDKLLSVMAEYQDNESNVDRYPMSFQRFDPQLIEIAANV